MNGKQIRKASLEELQAMMERYCETCFGHTDWLNSDLKFDPFIKLALRRLDKLKKGVSK